MSEPDATITIGGKVVATGLAATIIFIMFFACIFLVGVVVGSALP